MGGGKLMKEAVGNSLSDIDSGRIKSKDCRLESCNSSNIDLLYLLFSCF